MFEFSRNLIAADPESMISSAVFLKININREYLVNAVVKSLYKRGYRYAQVFAEEIVERHYKKDPAEVEAVLV